MAPSGGKMATRPRRNIRTSKLNKKIKKTTTKKPQQPQNQIPPPQNDVVQFPDDDDDGGGGGGGYSTPKAERFRIPEILTCPPGPKKQRPISDCSFRRSPIAFFAPPELELFFFIARPDISV